MSNEKQWGVLAVNKRYPGKLLPTDGAALELFAGGDRLLIAMSELTKPEIQALRKGSLEVGLLTQATAIALFWRFHDAKGRPLMEFDAPFDARRIDRQSLSLPSKEQVNEKLLINIIGVDRATGLIKALRLVSLPLRLSDDFLCAVADQLGAPERQAEADRVLLRWQQTPIETLSQQIRFETAGT